MGAPGPLELGLIFLVVLLIFGAKRIPEIARGVGKGIREFKNATSEISDEINKESQRQQINQPQSPQQGQPQPRQQPAQQQPAQQQQAAPQQEQPANTSNNGGDPNASGQ